MIICHLKSMENSSAPATDYQVIGDVTNGFASVAKRFPEWCEDSGPFEVDTRDLTDLRVVDGSSTQTAESLGEAMEIEKIWNMEDDRDNREWAETNDPERI